MIAKWFNFLYSSGEPAPKVDMENEGKPAIHLDENAMAAPGVGPPGIVLYFYLKLVPREKGQISATRFRAYNGK